jgi:hypothetical protein
MVMRRWRRAAGPSYLTRSAVEIGARPRKTPGAPVANVVVTSFRSPAIADDDFAGWRRRRLQRAGFEPALAEVVARDCAMDLHALLELVDRGCPPPLAARILAPIDGEHRPC